MLPMQIKNFFFKSLFFAKKLKFWKNWLKNTSRILGLEIPNATAALCQFLICENRLPLSMLHCAMCNVHTCPSSCLAAAIMSVMPDHARTCPSSCLAAAIMSAIIADHALLGQLYTFCLSSPSDYQQKMKISYNCEYWDILDWKQQY